MRAQAPGWTHWSLNSSCTVSYCVSLGTLSSLCLSFLFSVCKMEIIIVPTSYVVVRCMLKQNNKLNNLEKPLIECLGHFKHEIKIGFEKENTPTTLDEWLGP